MSKHFVSQTFNLTTDPLQDHSFLYCRGKSCHRPVPSTGALSQCIDRIWSRANSPCLIAGSVCGCAVVAAGGADRNHNVLMTDWPAAVSSLQARRFCLENIHN